MRRTWAVIGVAVFLAGAAEAQFKTIKGTVTDAATGDPVAGARVEIGGISTTTAADGTFTVSATSVGPVDMVVRAEGYRQALVTLPVQRRRASACAFPRRAWERGRKPTAEGLS